MKAHVISVRHKDQIFARRLIKSLFETHQNHISIRYLENILQRRTSNFSSMIAISSPIFIKKGPLSR